MASIAGLRERLPLVVFIFLLILLLMLLGFACVCLSDHPMQAVDRALVQILPGYVPPVEVWSQAALLLVALGVAATAWRPDLARPSPAGLQRFLF